MGLKLNFLIISMTVVFTLKQCPKYSCPDNEDTYCASLKTEKESNKVSLSNICKISEYCDIQKIVWRTLTDASDDAKYTCKNATVLPQSRFPGEDCETETECYSIKGDEKVGKCILDDKVGKKLCTGLAEGDSCTDHGTCMKGLFCDLVKKTCAKQKVKGEACISSWECINSLLCHEGTCSLEPYSLLVGHDVGEDVLDDYKCQFGKSFDNKCISYYQDHNANHPSGFIPCNYGDLCEYSIAGLSSNKTFSQDCECGYNTDGIGYCPLGDNKSKMVYNVRGKGMD
jgi:hypothetical protein